MADITSSVSRLVAFFVAPVLAVVVPAIVYWMQDAIGVDLDGEQLSILLTGVVVSVLGVVFKWLDGRAKFEVAEVQVNGSVPPEPQTLKKAA